MAQSLTSKTICFLPTRAIANFEARKNQDFSNSLTALSETSNSISHLELKAALSKTTTPNKPLKRVSVSIWKPKIKKGWAWQQGKAMRMNNRRRNHVKFQTRKKRRLIRCRQSWCRRWVTGWIRGWHQHDKALMRLIWIGKLHSNYWRRKPSWLSWQRNLR